MQHPVSLYAIPGIPPKHEVITYVAMYFGLQYSEVVSKCRKGDAMIARQVVHYILRKRHNMTLHKIAALTNCHHATVVHNVRIIEWDLEYAVTFQPKKDTRVYKVVKICGEI